MLQDKLISCKCTGSVFWWVVYVKLLERKASFWQLMHILAHLCWAVLCLHYVLSVCMQRKHKWSVKSILCQNLFDIAPSLSNKAKEALCYISGGEDIDMAFWWHYEASLISSYCVVTSNHTSSLAWAAAVNGRIELMSQVYEG